MCLIRRGSEEISNARQILSQGERYPQRVDSICISITQGPVDELCSFCRYRIVACRYLNTNSVHTVTSNNEAEVNTTSLGHVSLGL